MSGHPHAELAIQYWNEAKEDAEAWKNWEHKDGMTVYMLTYNYKQQTKR
jgi:hypothetical protein